MGRTSNAIAVLAVATLAVLAGACSDTKTTTYKPEAVWTIHQTESVTATERDDGWLVDFGIVALGRKATVEIEVTNQGSAPMTIPAVAKLGAPFSTDLPATGLHVGVAETKTIKLSFSPTESGHYEFDGAVDVVDYPEQALSLSIRGVGETPKFHCDTEELDFGRVVKGRPKSLDITCHNESSVDGVLVVQPISGDDRAQFTHRYTGDNGRVAVAKGESVAITVTFLANRSDRSTATLELLAELGDGVSNLAARVLLTGFTLDHAISCSPAILDFGFVAPGSVSREAVRCTNAASDPYELQSVALDASSHPVFAWSPTEYPIEVPGRVGEVDGEALIDVEFSPALEDAGRKNGILIVTTNDSTTPRIDVQMTGFAGGPVISCTPSALDFGTVAKGLPTTRSFVCTNIGTDDPTRTDDTLQVTGVDTTNPAEFSAAPRGEFKTSGYQIGESFTVDVTYNPVDDGVDSALALIRSNATNATEEEPFSVNLSGVGRDLPDCDFEIVPPSLRFGIVDRNSSATLEFAIRNRLTDGICLVQNLRLAPTCHPAYSLPGGEIALEELQPSQEMRVPVKFAPTEYSSDPLLCEVQFDITNKADPHQVVPLRGASQAPCALIAPNDLDFGTVRPGCASRNREFQIINTCNQPFVVGEVEINEGASEEFFVRAYPPPGTQVDPGLSVYFEVAYAPIDEGVDLGSVFVWVEDTPEPYMATLRGKAALDATQTDSYEQNDRPKVDLLWVIDNSGSMSEEQTAIADNLKPFLSFAQAQEIDYQIGVTTTGIVPGGGGCPGGANGGEDGRLFPVDNSRPRIITPYTANMEAVWSENIKVGLCHGNEQPLEAAFRALTPPVIDNCDDPRYPQPNDGNCGFLRKEAHLSIIAVTDEVDQSPETINFYYNAFLSLKGFRNTHLFNFHAITGDEFSGCRHPGTGSAQAGDRLIGMVRKTDGGVFQSICSTNWEAALREMSAAAFGFKTCFFLGNQPEDSNGNGYVLDTEGEIEVRMNGRVTPSVREQGQQTWQYNAEQNAVCFNPLSVPEPGTQLDISYRVACLNP